MAETLHIGRKIARVRELKGIKQEALAVELGVTQQTVSNIEKSEKIEDEVLNDIAKALGVPTEAIQNFNDEAVINFIANTYNDHAASYGHYYNFSPIDKIVTLYDEKVALLERLLASEREKVELLRNSNR